MLQAFLLAGSVICVVSLGLPSYIKPCSRSDPNLNACALQSAQESIHQFALGDPFRRIPPLDPLHVDELVVYIPNKQGLKVVFKNNWFKGLSALKMQSLKFDLDKKMIIADALVNLDVKNTYEIKGKLLTLPIDSRGPSSISLMNTLLHIRYWYKHIEGPDGQIYWKIFKNDIKYEVERATFRLENIMKDRNIAEQINRLLNEMWREIIAEVGPSIRDTLGDAVAENLGIFLEQVPYDQLMPE